jgi:putative ABC transport system substrate-binding protein
MKRRDFIGIACGAAAWPLAGRAQQKPMRVIGFLNSAPRDTLSGHLSSAFRRGLSETGYVEGQNLAIESRYADAHFDRLAALATDLVSRNVDVIVTVGGSGTARAAKNATSTIPIVFSTGTDPVQDGLVASYAHPGGNLTGFSIMATQLEAKRLELLSALVPALVPNSEAIAVLVNPNSLGSTEVHEAARAKGLQLHIVKAGSESEIDAAFLTLVELRAGAVIVSPDVLFNTRREQLVALASRYAIPAIYQWREFVDEGGLISYGTSLTTLFHGLGKYTGQILSGTKPADLPVQQPTKFELVINLKTAKALGLTVPQSLLQRADEVIE